MKIKSITTKNNSKITEVHVNKNILENKDKERTFFYHWFRIAFILVAIKNEEQKINDKSTNKMCFIK